MKWEQKESSNGYDRLQVEAEWAELAADYDDMVNKHARIKLPGFRAGKVPRSVIEQRCQAEISAALSQRAAQRFGRQAVQEAGLTILGPLEAETVECVKGRPFRVMLRFWPMPQITLPDLGSLGERAAAGVDLRDHISLRLLELVRFDLPEKLVKLEIGQSDTDAAEHGSAGWQAASDRLRLMLILKQIARQEGVSVDAADLQERIAAKAAEFDTTIEALQAELEQGGGMERLRDMLLAESTLEYLMERNT
jgi:FKBP-type peptidyl-prolyl cis-trans isomerase (trigger factor)